MTLNDLGWDNYLKQSGYAAGDFDYGRVAVENKESYSLLAEGGEVTGILRGKVLGGMEDGGFPKVGDWVRFSRLPGEDKAIIDQVLPRYSKISRKSPQDREQSEQVIVANVDVVLVVQALPDDFSLRRMERYLAVARQGGAKAVVVINKADLKEGFLEQVEEAKAVALDSPVVAVSAKSGHGMDDLKSFLTPSSTFVLLGSSGVGKSSLVNRIIGSERQATKEIRDYDSRGRHTTTKREMILLDNGAILIDTPGMRELSLWADEAELQESFTDIDDLSLQCRYTTCDHDKSEGCAVKAALDDGTLDAGRYQGFLKLKREAAYLSTKTDFAKRRERKEKDKGIHKKLKKHLKDKH